MAAQTNNNSTSTSASEAASASADTSAARKDVDNAADASKQSFPITLHNLLSTADSAGLAGIISWQPHGRAFRVHKRKEFERKVMKQYFNQSVFKSFCRQLNMYCFQRITEGLDKGAYYHRLFLRGYPMLCLKMTRLPKSGKRSMIKNKPWNENASKQYNTTTRYHPCIDQESALRSPNYHSDRVEDFSAGWYKDMANSNLLQRPVFEPSEYPTACKNNISMADIVPLTANTCKPYGSTLSPQQERSTGEAVLRFQQLEPQPISIGNVNANAMSSLSQQHHDLRYLQQSPQRESGPPDTGLLCEMMEPTPILDARMQISPKPSRGSGFLSSNSNSSNADDSVDGTMCGWPYMNLAGTQSSSHSYNVDGHKNRTTTTASGWCESVEFRGFQMPASIEEMNEDIRFFAAENPADG